MLSVGWNKTAWSFGLAALMVASGLADSALARPNTAAEYEFTLRQLDKAKARVAELENRLLQLQSAQANLQPRAAEPTPQTPQSCEQPFEFDSSGIKRWLDECPYGDQQLVAAPSCDEPFRVDRDGIKRVQAECVTQLPSDRL
jgi:hypothetical protein